MTFRNTAFAFIMAGLVAACSGLQLPVAEQTAATGDAFSKALYAEYIQLAKDEYGEGDYDDSDVFANRAIAAAGGKPTEPEAVAARQQDNRAAKALDTARKRLVTALPGSRGGKPADAARAQAMFECWAQEQEENFQPDHIDRCRIQFFIALAKIEQKAMAKPAAPAKPKPKLSPLTFIVYFDFNSAALNAAGQSVVATAAEVAKDSKPSVIAVIGHTDRAGSGDYNSALAEKRANAVADALRKLGVSGRLMTIGALGENATAVTTPDGARESGNRRVEITVRY